MRESTRLLKRLIALFLVVLMSIDTFAAIVGDNDGAAFITKAEFDSMKNNFQTQLDRYNSSLDTKVDGAIASYLSGVSVAREQSLNVLLKDADNITIRNYELENRYGWPAFNALISYYGAGGSAQQFNWFPSAYGIGCVAVGPSSPSVIKSVGLIAGAESYANDTTKNKFYWDGVVWDYDETVTAAKLGYNDYQDVGGAYHDIRMAIYDITKLDRINNKFYTDIRKKEFWKNEWYPQLQGLWDMNGTEIVRNWNPTWIGGYFSWLTNYSNDKETNFYELTYANIDQNVINPSWNNVFYKFDDNACTSFDMFNTLTTERTGTWFKAQYNSVAPAQSDGTYDATAPNYPNEAGIGKRWNYGYIESHFTPTDLNAYIYDYARGVTAGGAYPLPTCGGLGPISSNKIYIQKNNLKYNFDNKEYEKAVTTMNDGFPLLYAKTGTVITWSPVFSDMTGSSAVTTNGEIKVVLSYGEFGDGVTTAGGYVQADGSKGTGEYAFTTSDKTCKIKWTMQEDGWIYVKWYPAARTSANAANNTIDNDKWSITLDGTKSNKVTCLMQN